MACVEEMQQEMAAMKEFLIKQSREILKLKRSAGGHHLDMEDEEEDGLFDVESGQARLNFIEHQLAEQKRSTAKITKLCLAAIRALEKLEDRPQRLGGLDSASATPEDAASLVSQESLQNGGFDVSVGRSLCEEMAKLNKMLIKVDEDIEALDERTEDNRKDCDHILDSLKLLEDRVAAVSTTSDKVEADATLRQDIEAALRREINTGLRQELEAGFRKQLNTSFRQELEAGLRKELESSLRRELEAGLKKELTSNLRKEVEAAVTGKDLASKGDLARGLKTIPFGMSKEEVGQMIEFATRNFLRTVQAETKMCEERVQDSDEIHKTEIAKLKTQISDLETMCGKEMKNIQERTESNLKEVSRTLANLNNHHKPEIRQLEAKLDQEVRKINESLSNMAKEENRSGEEAKINNRMERLGKEISVLKLKLTECTTALEETAARQTTLENQTTGLRQSMGQKQDQVEKLSTLEQNLDSLAQKVEATAKLTQKVAEECHSKMEKTEVDDLKNGMEKERCKINYFQDKIANIAKSVEAVKIENNNMRDKFCSDIESSVNKLAEMKKLVQQHDTELKENSAALKDITKESIGKIKEVAADCFQIEKNIRSIKDKSVLFDNSLKELKDQITEVQYKSEQEIRTLNHELTRIQARDQGVTHVTEGDLKSFRETIKQVENEVNNLRQDRRTKESEDEERQLSLENSLLNLRSYVEAILNETNLQLGGIAQEVDTAQEKMTKCMSDVEQLVEQQGNSSLLRSSLEQLLKETREYSKAKNLDAIEKLLELRKEFVDKQSDLFETESENRLLVDQLRSELNSLRLSTELKDSLEARLHGLEQKIEASTLGSGGRVADLESKLKSVQQSLEAANTGSGGRLAGLEKNLSALSKELEQSRSARSQSEAAMTGLRADITRLNGSMEVQARTVAGLTESLTRAERENLARAKDLRERLAELTGGSQTAAEAVRREVEARLENLRRNLVEMIGSGEIHVREIEDRVKVATDAVANLKVVENNHHLNLENKLEVVKAALETVSAAHNKIKSQDTEQSIMSIKKDLEHVKSELSLNDLESFKNVVNSTNETHNKLIASIQKNVDTLLKERSKTDTLLTGLEARMAEVVARTAATEGAVNEAVKREQAEAGKIEERVRNMQAGMREMQERLSEKRGEEERMGGLKEAVEEAKQELGRRMDETAAKLAEVEEHVGSELSKMRSSVSSSGKKLQDTFAIELGEVSKTIQERSALADTRLNEALESIENQAYVINSLRSDLADTTTNLATSLDKLDTLDLKIKSLASSTADMEGRFAAKTALKAVEDRLVQLSAEQPAAAAAKEMEGKLSGLAAGWKTLEMTVSDLKRRDDSLEGRMKEINQQLDSLDEMGKWGEELKTVQSKFNQHKAKLIDVEAMVTFQERSVNKLGEDVKQLNGSVFGNIAKIEDRLGKFDAVANDMANKCNGMVKRSDGLTKDIEAVKLKTETMLKEVEAVRAKTEAARHNDSLSKEAETARARTEARLESLAKEVEAVRVKAEAKLDTRVHTADLERMHTLVSEEVGRVGKEVDSVKSNLTHLSNSLPSIANLLTREEFNHLDASVSKLSSLVEDIQSKIFSQQEGSTDQLESINSQMRTLQKHLDQITADKKDERNGAEAGKAQEEALASTKMVTAMQTTITGLERSVWKLEEEMKKREASHRHQENQLSLIEKQRRGWEGARDKAEEMAQIFDSLIITNDRPYVSCSLEEKVTLPGNVAFNQFELINKIEWEGSGFCLLEPGVYLLHLAGSLSNCRATVQLVSDQLEAELMVLQGAPNNGAFRSRSTIFTVEDDDRDAEKITVELHRIQEREAMWADSDFALLMYKISEVSTGDSGDAQL